ncbi:hypothetical protein [uncultured Sphingomonas sp.]|uniref:hypothetical protein n=1 Tax=uncultured Sphingomonas sp. TaxID=158754 RepID=UPI0025998D15|nr:hypothetical protein [uncultured Sphingomonas sp.]
MTEATQTAVVGENTISKMVKAKIIQARQNGLFIQIKNVHDKLRPDGSNWNSRDMNSAKTKADVDGIVKHILAGGMLPAIEVQPRADGGIQKVDGYCRAAAYAVADASGIGELWVPIVPFIGTELEALARTSTSNKDSKINPLEQLDNYNRIRDQLIIDGNPKPSLQDIADVVGVSRQYVDQILKLNALDAAGKALVGEGKVTVAIAVKAVRADSENATALLEEAAKNAEAQGKKKATDKTAKPITIGTPLLLDIHQIGLNLRENISKDAAAVAEKFLKGDIKGDAPVTMPVRDIAMLLAALREGDRQVEDAKAKAQAKADKAKQQALPESPDLGGQGLDDAEAEQLKQEELDRQQEEEFNIPDGAPDMPEIPDEAPDAEDNEDSFAFLG